MSGKSLRIDQNCTSAKIASKFDLPFKDSLLNLRQGIQIIFERCMIRKKHTNLSMSQNISLENWFVERLFFNVHYLYKGK